MEEVPPDPETMLVLGKLGFQLGLLLAHGAYWEVYEAAAPPLWHKVAIKVISKREALEEDLRKLLPHQMQVLKGLCHKHLVRLCQGMEMRTGFYLLMELAPSGSVLEWVQSQGPCSQGQAGLWFSQLLLALAYLHSRASVHPDLKLKNLLLDSKDNVKVSIPASPGGWPCRMPVGSPSASPHAGLPAKAVLSRTFCGSYAYTCPKILQVQPYNPFLAGTWSTGVVLYALLPAFPCLPPKAAPAPGLQGGGLGVAGGTLEGH
ncbi:LOW QUALITY PROTEIN: testis-specific serine/threonine-protein kinase 4-like [Gymnogyps californianus]|uniref:LOW QUALITY PROTEIN: testis-specific serine/threonine-protein kinase 4-like n=1 Tax=Gymnogyps californianus TaxID=33616 RepID=UPI0021C64257|nr:LOW QUALITY PROTEIN: testis-specific serine/threonine-protein kinase 4-like [Gymnogyps californianus]